MKLLLLLSRLTPSTRRAVGPYRCACCGKTSDRLPASWRRADGHYWCDAPDCDPRALALGWDA